MGCCTPYPEKTNHVWNQFLLTIFFSTIKWKHRMYGWPRWDESRAWTNQKASFRGEIHENNSRKGWQIPYTLYPAWRCASMEVAALHRRWTGGNAEDREGLHHGRPHPPDPAGAPPREQEEGQRAPAKRRARRWWSPRAAMRASRAPPQANHLEQPCVLAELHLRLGCFWIELEER
jgi:hypothetical protein